MSKETHGNRFDADPAGAGSALVYASQAQAKAASAVRSASAWTAWFLASYGLVTVVSISLTAVGGVAVYGFSWVAYGVIASWFQRRERVSWRGFDRLSSRVFIPWLLLQAAGCGIGFNWFDSAAVYWIALSLLTSMPMFAGAWQAARR